MSWTTAAPSFVDWETDRLRAHFEWVLALLRAQDTRALDADKCARRERTLALLSEYADRGRFPQNTTGSDRMLPAFVDVFGTTCAVAFLMGETGHADLAHRIHRTMNLAYVPQIRTRAAAELDSWANAAGLTPEEAALVQPDYCPSSGKINSGCAEIVDHCTGPGVEHCG